MRKKTMPQKVQNFFLFNDFKLQFFSSTFLQEVSPCGWIHWNSVVAFASEV